MKIKLNKKYLSFYYEEMADTEIDLKLDLKKTALMVVDMQKFFLAKDGTDARAFKAAGQWDKWEPYFDRIEQVTVPNNKKLIDCCRKNGVEVTYGRIACLKENGADRCLVQSTVGWNNILLPISHPEAGMMDPIAPVGDEIVVNKTTDSVSLGTNYSELMRNMGIDTIIVTGVVTDQCVAGTVRVLADHGFRVICVEDCCAAPDMELHDMELKIMNIVYCNVLECDEVIALIEDSVTNKQ